MLPIQVDEVWRVTEHGLQETVRCEDTHDDYKLVVLSRYRSVLNRMMNTNYVWIFDGEYWAFNEEEFML